MRHDSTPCLDMKQVKPALEEAGARYLARGKSREVYEGDWSPRRVVLLEFPSTAAGDAFYYGPVYQGVKSIRDECSSARPLEAGRSARVPARLRAPLSSAGQAHR